MLVKGAPGDIRFVRLPYWYPHNSVLKNITTSTLINCTITIEFMYFTGFQESEGEESLHHDRQKYCCVASYGHRSRIFLKTQSKSRSLRPSSCGTNRLEVKIGSNIDLPFGLTSHVDNDRRYSDVTCALWRLKSATTPLFVRQQAISKRKCLCFAILDLRWRVHSPHTGSAMRETVSMSSQWSHHVTNSRWSAPHAHTHNNNRASWHVADANSISAVSPLVCTGYMTWKVWKHFLHYGLFLGVYSPQNVPVLRIFGIFPDGKVQGANMALAPGVSPMNLAIWVLPCSPEQSVQGTVDLPLIWDTMALIWRHRTATELGVS